MADPAGRRDPRTDCVRSAIGHKRLAALLSPAKKTIVRYTCFIKIPAYVVFGILKRMAKPIDGADTDGA